MQFVERDNLFHNQVDVLVVAINGAGKVVANDRQLTEVRLKRETYETVARVGFRVISRVDLPRGEYQIRAGIREANGGRIGSIRYELTVPDFGEPLSMSGVLVTSARAVLVPTLRPDERLERVLPAPPTTERAFVRGDTVAVFAELYANRTARELLAATELVTPDGHAVFRTSEERIAVAANGRAPYGIQVPLGPVQEGPYVIRIAIRDARSGAAILECRIPVSVESPAAP
jgi:hypothetical protein